MATCKICGKPVIAGVVAHMECIDPWVPNSVGSMPDKFVTAQIHVPDEVPFPTVLPAYLGTDGLFHARLNRTFGPEEVTHWAPMNKPPEVE